MTKKPILNETTIKALEADLPNHDNFYIPSADYECDICNGKESIVGNLRSGRDNNGRDWQVCEKCFQKMKEVA